MTFFSQNYKISSIENNKKIDMLLKVVYLKFYQNNEKLWLN